MPKAARTRSAIHAKAAPLHRKPVPDDIGTTSHAPAFLEPAVNVAPDVTLDVEPLVPQVIEDLQHEPMKKKQKQSLKHEKFLQRLEASRSPYSKSHERRLKRRAKEQVASGLDDIKAAISAVEMGETLTATNATTHETAQVQPKLKPRLEPGQIGEGKHTPLSKAQRKQALAAERLRIPRILSNSEFSSNPFETIRKHAQNTLIKHEIPK